MPNNYFSFKEFTIQQDACAMKVCTDACLFGAWCAQELSSANDSERLLDIGTGSALLSLMIAQKSSLSINAVELDPGAAEQAKTNVTQSNFNNIEVIQANILDYTPGNYNYIISNPPFYESELSSPSPGRSSAHHNTGLLWKEFFQLINAKLSLDGTFFLLLPYKRVKELDTHLMKNELHLHTWIRLRHSANHPSTRLLIKGGKASASLIQEEWSIKEGTEYSAVFKQLLKDYYLAL